MVKGMEGLSEDERKALRGSKFGPLPPKSNCNSNNSRLAHPGGPLKTNKAVALAKFLERKLNEAALDSIHPQHLQLAIQNATTHCGTSKNGQTIRHVTSFDDYEECSFKDESTSKPKKKLKKEKKHKKQKKKKMKFKMVSDP